MYWGLSESLDLYQEYINAFKKQQNPEENEAQPAASDKKDSEQELEQKEIVRDFEENDKSHQDNEEVSEDVTQMNNCEENIKQDTSKGAIKKIINKPMPELIADKDLPVILEDDVNFTDPRELHILLFGPSDPRHILQTMSKMYKHRLENKSLQSIHFYVIDGCIEITARNILLMAIALENEQFFSLIGKTHLFMDIYGNALLRPTSHYYMVAKARALLKIVTDPELLIKLAPMLDLDLLKYIERDGLENAFNFWLPKPGNVFDICHYWDYRNRKLLGERYDYKTGAFDWDLNMTLKYRRGKQICNQEYRHWRETGIAYTYPEYEQCKPNKTLAAGLVRNGDKYKHRGYVGDMQTGPFCAYGLRTNDASMMKSFGGENDYRATDVSERNLLELMHELQTNTPYVHNKELSRKFGNTRLQMGKCLTAEEADGDKVDAFMEPWIHKEGVKIHFLAAEEINKMQLTENRWQEFFDIVFLGHNYYPFIKDNFAQILKPQSLLLMETKTMTVLRKEQVVEFETTLHNLAKQHNFKPVINYSALNSENTVLKYKRNRIQ